MLAHQMTMNDCLILLLAYLLGSIPFGFLLVKLKSGDDIRAVGSGGTGATNVSRKAGKVSSRRTGRILNSNSRHRAAASTKTMRAS